MFGHQTWLTIWKNTSFFCFMIFPFTCPLIKYFPVKTCWTTEAKKKRYSTTFHDYSISSSSHYVPMIPPFIECKTHYQIIQFWLHGYSPSLGQTQTSLRKDSSLGPHAAAAWLCAGEKICGKLVALFFGCCAGGINHLNTISYVFAYIYNYIYMYIYIYIHSIYRFRVSSWGWVDFHIALERNMHMLCLFFIHPFSTAFPAIDSDITIP